MKQPRSKFPFPAFASLACAACLASSSAHAQGPLAFPRAIKDAVSAQPAAAASPRDAAMLAVPLSAERLGRVEFPALTLTGKAVHDAGSGTASLPGVMYGRFVGGVAAGDHFQVAAFDENGSLVLELKVAGKLADFAKPSYSATFARRGGTDATAELSYRVYRVSCFPVDGTVTLTSFGDVDRTVAGTISNIKWAPQQGQPECSKLLGTSAKFEVPRAVDFEPFKH